MCGRYSLGVDTDRLIAEFGLAVLTADHAPRFNIAPGQDVPAVVMAEDGLRLGPLRWGLVPRDAGDPGAGKPMINARSETVDRRPAFAASFRARRCWVLADGFYEWRTEPGGGRQPFHLRLPGGRPFALAGIWDRWSGGDQDLLTCAILTTESAPAVRDIHHRMPVILPAEDRMTWLDSDTEGATLKDLLRPYRRPLETYPVDARVNSSAHDDPSCVRPLTT